MGTTERPQAFGNALPVPRSQPADSAIRAVHPGSPFEAADLLVPRVPPATFKKAVTEPRPPRFLAEPRDYHFEWTDLLKGVFSFYPLHLRNISVDLFRNVPLLPRRVAARPLGISLILHLAAIPLLPLLLTVIPRSQTSDDNSRLDRKSVVYYRVKRISPLTRPPILSPFGPGSSPGMGDATQQNPTKGATNFRSSLFAVSRPHIADNNRQTILEPRAPDLKIRNDVRLPNLVLPQAPPARPNVRSMPNDARPLQPKQQQARTEAPKLPNEAPALAARNFEVLPLEHARLAAPIGSVSAPLVPTPRTGTDIETAPSFSNAADGQSISTITTTQAKLEAPLGGVSSPNLSARRGIATDLDSAPVFESNAANNEGLIALSIDPRGPKEIVSIPVGSRSGAFVVGPSASEAGAPGAKENSGRQGGTDGAGPGGNESTGLGKGNFGGGGGDNASTYGFISLRGEANRNSLLADPGPAAVAQMVYALPASTLLRHNALVVSAGPVGGGGSNVYGELPCTRIYTVFLPTGGKQWSLQYCDKTHKVATTESRTLTTVVHTELPLLPPEAKESYDFKRLPLPPEKVHKSIILRGIINEEGNVERIEVRQGLLPAMDAAAALAFSEWKFKPAMRSGQPVRVEVLVAIPPDQPKQR